MVTPLLFRDCFRPVMNCRAGTCTLLVNVIAPAGSDNTSRAERRLNDEGTGARVDAEGSLRVLIVFRRARRLAYHPEHGGDRDVPEMWAGKPATQRRYMQGEPETSARRAGDGRRSHTGRHASGGEGGAHRAREDDRRGGYWWSRCRGRGHRCARFAGVGQRLNYRRHAAGPGRSTCAAACPTPTARSAIPARLPAAVPGTSASLTPRHFRLARLPRRLNARPGTTCPGSPWGHACVASMDADGCAGPSGWKIGCVSKQHARRQDTDPLHDMADDRTKVHDIARQQYMAMRGRGSRKDRHVLRRQSVVIAEQ